jgi:hypothetical protein
MLQAGPSRAPRGSKKKSAPIIRTGNITNSILVVGDNNQLTINDEGNAIIDRLMANQGAKIRRRASPVIIGRPSHPTMLIDRDGEKTSVHDAFQQGNSVEFYSAEGLGKTTLLRYLSNQLQIKDGMVFIDMGKTLEDLLQELFEAYYHSDQPYKATQVEYKRRFENVRALILIDNYQLTREETQVLLGILPNCVFVLASHERHLWEQGNVIHLGGLPLDDAVSLFQLQVGRQLAQNEMPFAQAICADLKGHPLDIIRAAALVHDDGLSLKDVARQTHGPDSAHNILESNLARLPDGSKSLLALLATFRNVPLPAKHITAILRNTQLARLLRNLVNRGLVRSHSPSYSLTGNLGPYLSGIWDLSPWNATVLRYFVEWSSRPLSMEQTLDSAAALMVALENASATNHWQEVLQIGMAIEPSLAISRKWSLWEQLLQLLIQAALALKDRFIEAWALHQLGSRALCLGNLRDASAFLTQALEIRRAIGDQSGANATLHNLTQFPGWTPPRNPPRTAGGSSSGFRLILPLTLIISIAAILFFSSVNGPGFQFPPVLEPTTLTPTRTLSSTLTVSSTSTLTATLTPSLTPTLTDTPTNTPRPVVIDSFTAEDSRVISGTCTNLHWIVENADRVLLDGTDVDINNGSQQVCPYTTTNFTLSAASVAGFVERQVTVLALDPYPPPGYSPSMGCFPWSYSVASTYYSPTVGCYDPVDTCLQAGAGCGKPAADAWCGLYTPYNAAKSWELNSPGGMTRYIGSKTNCYFFSCNSFKSITCDIYQ